METLQNASKMFQVAEIELVYNVHVKASQRPKISSAKDVYKILMENWNKSRIDFLEEFKIILLNEEAKCLGLLPSRLVD